MLVDGTDAGSAIPAVIQAAAEDHAAVQERERDFAKRWDRIRRLREALQAVWPEPICPPVPDRLMRRFVRRDGSLVIGDPTPDELRSGDGILEWEEGWVAQLMRLGDEIRRQQIAGHVDRAIELCPQLGIPLALIKCALDGAAEVLLKAVRLAPRRTLHRDWYLAFNYDRLLNVLVDADHYASLALPTVEVETDERTGEERIVGEIDVAEARREMADARRAEAGQLPALALDFNNALQAADTLKDILAELVVDRRRQALEKARCYLGRVHDFLDVRHPGVPGIPRRLPSGRPPSREDIVAAIHEMIRFLALLQPQNSGTPSRSKRRRNDTARRRNSNGDSVLLLTALRTIHKTESDQPRTEHASQKELLEILGRAGWKKYRLSRAFKILFPESGMRGYKSACASEAIGGFLKKLDDGGTSVDAMA